MTAPNEPFPPAEPGIDAVVRAQLDAEASRTDPAPMWVRVLAQLEADATPATPAPVPQHRSSRRWFALAGLAAAVLVGVFLLVPPQQALATPVQVVEAARAAHPRDADRCYSQTVSLPTDSPAPLMLVSDSGRTVTICTRGDRFHVEPGFGGKGAWGRDGEGRVWIAPTRDAAVRFAESELPPFLREMLKIRGLEVGPLLDEVLKDFDLTWTEPPARRAEASKVTATRRGAARPGQVHSAELVIEKHTNQLRSLVLRRQLISGGHATITFTLQGTGAFDPAVYTAEGHLDAGKPVYDSTRPLLRRRVLLRDVGEVLANGL